MALLEKSAFQHELPEIFNNEFRPFILSSGSDGEVTVLPQSILE